MEIVVDTCIAKGIIARCRFCSRLQSCEPENQQECDTWLTPLSAFVCRVCSPNHRTTLLRLAALWLTIQANCCLHAHGYRIVLLRISNSSIWGTIKPLNIPQLKAFGSAIELECCMCKSKLFIVTIWSREEFEMSIQEFLLQWFDNKICNQINFFNRKSLKLKCYKTQH